MNAIFNSPKRANGKEIQTCWYDYYAGYSYSFVRDFLSSLKLDENAIVLDPWNGSGATTYTALIEGYQSIGVDLNPVMKIISTGKLANHNQINSAKRLCGYLRNKSRKKYISSNDYLLLWFHEDTANYIRYIDSYLYKHSKIDFNFKIENINIIQSIIYLALFNIIRKYLSKFIPSNPTWIKSKIDQKEKIYISEIKIKKLLLSFLEEKSLLAKSIKYPLDLNKAKIIHATATQLPINNDSIDAIITSPPYCTRIDYGVATLPELAVIIGYDPTRIDSIRRSLTGRTTIDKNLLLSPLNIGEVGLTFLKSVKTHHSVASAGYYYKNYYQYFSDVSCTIKEINRVLKNEGFFGCVVQDSFYKEVYCNLSQIIIDMAEINGLKLINRQDFCSKNNMANINKRSKKYRKQTIATESVLLFKKGKDNGTY